MSCPVALGFVCGKSAHPKRVPSPSRFACGVAGAIEKRALFIKTPSSVLYFWGGVFFAYLASAMMGFFVVASISTFFKDEGKLSRAQWNLRAVTLAYLVLCVLYIIIDYYLLIMVHQTDTCILFRIIDITAWMATKYFWYIFIIESTILSESAKTKLKRIVVLAILPITLIAAFNYGVFMDENYYVSGENARIFVWCVQLVSVCATLSLNVVFLVVTYKHCYYQGIKHLVYVMTSLLIINGAWNGFITLFLITGKVQHIAWNKLPDPTSIIFLAINILLFLLVKNYHNIELASRGIESKINRITERYNLTERESEVARYLYKGLTYVGIADELTISKNTVKRHIHNIYKKMEIESRNQFVDYVDNILTLPIVDTPHG